MWLHFILILIVPFALLFWLNSSIYKKLSEQALTLQRTGQKYLRRREMRLGKRPPYYVILVLADSMFANILTISLMKKVHFPGRVSMMIVLVYLLCHSPKLILTFCEIMFKNPKASLNLSESTFYLLCTLYCTFIIYVSS